jgi:hypothetical protein
MHKNLFRLENEPSLGANPFVTLNEYQFVPILHWLGAGQGYRD